VFLDLDGTLTDPKPGITGAVIHTLTVLGMDAPGADDLEWVIGPALLDSFTKLGAPDPQRALAIYREHYTEIGLFNANVYPGVHAALDQIAGAGHRMFLMTAKPHVYATRITAHFGLDSHLERQFGPELDGTFNDKAELLGFALEQTGIDPKDSFMIGDRSHDRNAARANAVRFIAADWGYGSMAEHEGAIAVCKSPADLPGLIA